MTNNSNKTVTWLIGRGASIACKLDWDDQEEWTEEEWRTFDRNIKIAKIKEKILEEMESPKINTTVYKDFLKIIMNHTARNWRHCFITTNWDYLLQREIDALELEIDKYFRQPIKPPWLFNGHVYHLNGTVEVLDDNQNRSPFLFEDDPINQRVKTIEANVAFNIMTWRKLFVVIGMSFKCPIDESLMIALNKVQDDLPVGESKWLLVNDNEETLEKSAVLIKKYLPNSTIIPIKAKFEDWVKNRMPQLSTCGVLV